MDCLIWEKIFKIVTIYNNFFCFNRIDNCEWLGYFYFGIIRGILYFRLVELCLVVFFIFLFYIKELIMNGLVVLLV